MSESTSNGHGRRNALADETSPYLLQHADNPVDWHPWGPEALERARREDRPILVSVGYSACHWCHVMAHESFEDPETAALMNEHFVNVKVDREERPDLDKIYQLSHQLLMQRGGGWPLTIFLAPDDLAPFFAGTYFPREARYGMPSFGDVLVGVARIYLEQRERIREQNASLMRSLADLEPDPGQTDSISPAPVEASIAALRQSFDGEHGGFGGAPKFPHPTNLELLLRVDAGRGEAGEMAVQSLRSMLGGGIYDQLGGGFCRYSVDARWEIPHFEKMLYDNGPLLGLLAEAHLATGDPLFAIAARETGAWVMRDMCSPEGGYYATLDADSEGEEGKFYVWTPEETAALLAPEVHAAVAARFGLDAPPNFEGSAWHLRVARDLDEVARETGADRASVEARLREGRATLLAARERRVWPGRDEKILTAWNALMIKGMAGAARMLGEPALLESAERALEFVRRTLWRDGRLFACHTDGQTRLAAYLDDYAFLADAILALLENRFDRKDLDLAMALADALLEHFEDRERGGFFFTADDHEQLMHRPKPFMDDALPAGNAVAATVLGRLGHLVGDSRYLEAAQRTLSAAWEAVTRHPFAHNGLLLAAREYLAPPEVIVLRGSGPELERWRSRCARGFAPDRRVYPVPSEAGDLPGALADRAPRGPVVAYLCRGHQCEAPITEFAALEQALGPD
jgi:uncharacterized protein YyaL (SSP411 family)